MVLVRIVAGVFALGVSGLLLVVVLVRDHVVLNPLNGWTILLGFLGAGLLLGRSDRASALGSSVLLLALLPALIGGLGLLYLPPLVLGLVVKAGGGSEALPNSVTNPS